MLSRWVQTTWRAEASGVGAGGFRGRVLPCLKRPWVHAVLLYLLTFGVVLPLLCQGLRQSRYFTRAAHLRRLTEEALEHSRARGEEAERYVREADPGHPARGAPVAVVAVVTVSRKQAAAYRYYLQVVSALHRMLASCRGCRGYRLFACNVDPEPDGHWEAPEASRLILTVQRFGRGRGRPSGGDDNRFEKEKQDYAYCLQEALSAYGPRHVVLLEDDAVPTEDFFLVLRDLLERRLTTPAARGALYVKLYHPERLQGYLNPEPMRVLEWLGLGALGGTSLSIVYRKLCRRASVMLSWAVLALYTMLVVELAGRHYLLEWRRLSPQLYSLMPATECCTPATLFSAPAARRVLAYLGSVRCRAGYAKDTALYALLREHGETAYALEPNLVTHIGLYSTLRGPIAQPSL
ncbi:post-GPI attachment to proteins factor 4-like [Stegostoma tigrinum]|uniref:post-GPI attachment to proteins factor 4-like n=1 Tax=Stegostoma tigrinum TaxID=3053191 RepID=UPI00286FB60B|nr:post-GPI attachment to proteins factor 4-like [Stegostoma tigrinum]